MKNQNSRENVQVQETINYPAAWGATPTYDALTPEDQALVRKLVKRAKFWKSNVFATTVVDVINTRSMSDVTMIVTSFAEKAKKYIKNAPHCSGWCGELQAYNYKAMYVERAIRLVNHYILFRDIDTNEKENNYAIVRVQDEISGKSKTAIVREDVLKYANEKIKYDLENEIRSQIKIWWDWDIGAPLRTDCAVEYKYIRNVKFITKNTFRARRKVNKENYDYVVEYHDHKEITEIRNGEVGNTRYEYRKAE